MRLRESVFSTPYTGIVRWSSGPTIATTVTEIASMASKSDRIRAKFARYAGGLAEYTYKVVAGLLRRCGRHHLTSDDIIMLVHNLAMMMDTLKKMEVIAMVGGVRFDS